MRNRVPVLVVVVLLVLMGWSAAQMGDGNTQSEVSAVKSFNQNYLAAEKSANVDKMANMWASDGVILPPGEPPVVGSKQIHAWLEKNRIDPATMKMTENVANWRDISVSGNYATQWGETYVDVRSADGSAGMHMSGTKLQVLKKEPDGSWRLYRSSWSQHEKGKDKIK